MNDWYENIEPEIREIVKYLRNNGINTESSCGHEMIIQCQFLPDGMLQDINHHLYNYYYEKDGMVPDYEIISTIKRQSGAQYTSIEIRIINDTNR